MSPDPQEVLAALDELLARTPAERLPALLEALHVRAGTALSRLTASTWEDGGGSSPAAADENLSVREAARRLGVSADWLYDNARNLPFAVRIGRRLLFSARGLERWNRQRQGR